MPLADAERRYGAIVKALAGQLKVQGRIFAMLVRGNLVVKLPRQEVDRAVAAGLASTSSRATMAA